MDDNQIHYEHGRHPNSLNALREHQWRKGRPKAHLTQALKKVLPPEELAALIAAKAREGDPTALRLAAQYTQAPELVSRTVESDDASDAIGYDQATDTELEQTLAQAESILTELTPSD